VGTEGPTLPSSIVGKVNGTGTINETYYLTGYFGLGMGSGSFKNNLTPLPALNALVKTEGQVPSNSYGFTAGAVYREFYSVHSLYPLAEYY
jgi:hypothetical protein